MKIPHIFDEDIERIRELRNEVSDSKNIFKDKVSSVLKSSIKNKKVLSKQERKEVSLKILNDNKSHEIPLNKKLPLVSIIIKATHKNYLLNLLNTFSTLDTYYSNYELIIIHNMKDDLLKYIDNKKDVILVSCEDKSLTQAENEASHKSKGEYLLFIDDDTIPFDGFLNHMVNTMLTKENVGVVGSRLIYPELKLNRTKSYKVAHEGIYFREKNNLIETYNKNDGRRYYTADEEECEVIATSSVAFLVKKSVLMGVGGFNENYVEFYEVIDLCLRLHKKDYKNYYNPKVMLYHFCLENHDVDVFERDKKIFINTWNKYILHNLLKDKLYANYLFSDKALTVALVVTQSVCETTAGDFFTAITLAHNLKDFGWNIKFLSQHPSKYERNWYHLDDDIDVVISLLDRYNLRKIESNRKSLIKVAWIRNWFERWMKLSYLDDYNIILSSSKKACGVIGEKIDRKVYFYPLATDSTIFNEKLQPNNEYICDYCFTGSYWKSDREIISALCPDNIDYTFNLYGANWDKIPSLKKYHKGFIKYDDIPQVYASTKIVLDDANHVTRGWGSVNSRVFDAFASGCLVLTNGTMGNTDLFNGMIPEYHSKEELQDKINYYMEHTHEKEKIVQEIQEIILEKHTYKHRATKLKSLLNFYIHKYTD